LLLLLLILFASVAAACCCLLLLLLLVSLQPHAIAGASPCPPPLPQSLPPPTACACASAAAKLTHSDICNMPLWLQKSMPVEAPSMDASTLLSEPLSLVQSFAHLPAASLPAAIHEVPRTSATSTTRPQPLPVFL
jgi:hypothetical protein